MPSLITIIDQPSDVSLDSYGVFLLEDVPGFGAGLTASVFVPTTNENTAEVFGGSDPGVAVAPDAVAPGAPVVDPLTTADTQPTITGTYDPSDFLSLRVIVDGKAYTSGVDAALTVNAGAGTWSLDLGAAGQSLAPGTFDVQATQVDPGANTTTDVASDELVVTPPALEKQGFVQPLAGGDSLSSVSSVAIGENWTIVGFIAPTGAGTNSGNIARFLLASGDACLASLQVATNTILGRGRDSAGTSTDVSLSYGALDTGIKRFFWVTADAAGMTIGLDDPSAPTTTSTAWATGSPGGASTTSEIWFGSASGSNLNTFKGTYDTAIYSSALTTPELQALFDAGSLAAAEGVAATYPRPNTGVLPGTTIVTPTTQVADEAGIVWGVTNAGTASPIEAGSY